MNTCCPFQTPVLVLVGHHVIAIIYMVRVEAVKGVCRSLSSRLLMVMRTTLDMLPDVI